jgi:hypothetical protein
MTEQHEKNVPIAFDHIDQIIRRCPGLTDCDIGVAYPILAAYCVDLFVVNVCQRHRTRYGYSTLVFLPHDNRGGFLVKPNAEALQFSLDELLIPEGLENVQDDEYEVAGPRD